MQKWVLQNRNHWMVMTGIFILISFGLKMLSAPGKISTYFLMGASLIGGFPIAIQAMQALRVKVISIDVLVTLAIAGAFGIRSFEESAIVSFLFLFGAYLEQKTLAKTRSAIQSLVEMAPASAWRKNKSGAFNQVLMSYPEIALKLFELTARKMVQLEKQTQFLSMERVEERLANYLLNLPKTTVDNEITIPMRMMDVAQYLGTTPETLSRKLKNLETAGLIQRSGRRIKILDVDALENV